MDKEKEENQTTDKDLEDALDAGFVDDPKYILPEEEIKEEIVEPLAKIEEKEDPAPEVDEWEGISDNIKNKFNSMQTALDKATNIANSASGRVNKFQSEQQKKKDEPVEPKITSDIILEAMSSKERRDELSEDFPEFAHVFDELDKNMSKAVGETMDSRLDSFRQEMIANNLNMQERNDTQRILDIAHVGWENTINDDSFKDFVYKDGPNTDEQSSYEYLLNQSAIAETPIEKNAASAKANDYYKDLLSSYPNWAEEKGDLYGDPSGKAAIKLLDLYKKVDDTIKQKELSVNKISDSKKRLENNIAPTSGRNRQAPVFEEEDVDAAFDDGFKNG